MKPQTIGHEFTSREGVSEATARQRTERIKHHLTEAGRELLIVRKTEEWRLLGYQSFTQYLEFEFAETRQHLYDLMRAAPVKETLQQRGYTLNTAQAIALAKLPEEIRVVVYETVANTGKPVTADRLMAQGAVQQEIVVTGGYVTTEDGEQRAAGSAYRAQRREGEIAKRDYVAQNASVCITEIDEYGIVTQPIILSLTDIQRVQVGQTVRVSVWIEEAQS